jgi:putative transposase
MPYLKVWPHLVWSTKERFPFLRNDIRDIVFDHISTNAKKERDIPRLRQWLC